MKKLTLLFFTLSISLFYAQSPNLTLSLTACYALDGNGIEPINNLTGTLSSVTSTVNRFNNPNSAYHFSGSSSSYIQLPNSPLLKPTNTISFSSWVRLDASSNQIILYTHNGCVSYFEGYCLAAFNIGTNVYKFRLVKSSSACSSSTEIILDGATTLSAQTWYHVGFYMGNDSMKVYVNGSLDGAMPLSIPFAYNSAANVYLGGTNLSFNYPFSGSLDNVRFYNRKLTGTEFNLLYTTDPTCTNTPGEAINCDGVNDFLDPNVLVSSFSNSFTIESWVRPTTTIQINPEATSGITGMSNQKYLLWPTWRNTEGGLGISVGTNGVSVYEHGNNFMPALLTWTGTINAWTHLAVVVISKQPFLYINGVLVKTGLTSTKTNLWPSLGAANTTTVYPFVGGIGGGSYGYYQGDIDEFRLWSSVRTSTDIVTYMNTEFNCPPAGLYAYYKFNHGIASANNATVTSATDYSGNNYTAALNNFTLSGNTSNWIAPGAVTSATSTAMSASASNSMICSGQSTTLTATGAGSYTWIPGFANTPVIIVTPSVTTTYSVFSSGGACSGSAVVNVFVNPTPTVINTSGNPTICPGNSVSLIAGGAASYTWLPGNLTGSVLTVNPPSTTVYTAIGSNGGCTGSANFTVTVIPGPALSPSAFPPAICPGNSSSLSANNASSYTWQPGNLNSASITVTPASTTVYTVIGTNSSCSASANVTVTVVPYPILNPSVSGSVICPGYPTTLNSGVTITTTPCTWQPGNLNGSAVSVNPVFSTIYTVTATNSLGCSSSATLLLTVSNCTLPLPSCNNTGFYSMSANNSGIYFTSSNNTASTTSFPSVLPPGANGLAIGPAFGFSAPNPTYWTTIGGTYWYHTGNTFINTGHLTGPAGPGSGYVNPGGSKNYIYNLSTSGGQGTVSVYNGTGNATVLGFAPVAPTSIVADIVGDELDNYYLTGCCSSSLNVYNSTGTLICSYGHSSSLGITSSSPSGLAIADNTIYVYDTGLLTGTIPGSVINYSTASYGGGLSDFANCPMSTFSSSISASPNATLSCFTPTLQLSASAFPIGPALSYTWSGPSVLSSPNNQAVQVGSAGVYTCYLKNCPGLISVATYTVFYNAVTLTVNINASGNVHCLSGPAVTLTATGANVFTWSPASSLSSTLSQVVAANPTITTTYITTGFLGLCTGSAAITVSVVPNPVLTAFAANPIICKGNSTSLQVNGGANYTWFPGNLQGNNIIVSPTGTTIYSVTGSNSSGCTTTETVSVIVNNNPTITTASSASAICLGSSATITAGGATTYTWYPGGSMGQSIVVTPTLPSTIIYSVVGSVGSCTDSATTILILHITPVVSAFASQYTICAGSPVVLTGAGANNYTWTPGGSVGNNTSVSPLSTAIYTVTGANPFGCTDTETIGITVNPSPTLIVTSSNNSVCSGSSATLTAAGAINYSWNPGPINTSQLIVSPNTTTNYSLTGIDIFGCSSSTGFILPVTATPTVFVASSTNTICSGNNATLTANGANTYTWALLNQAGSSIIVSPAVATSYTVTGETAGCKGNGTIFVNVIQCETPVFGLTNAAGNPGLFNANYYKIGFTVTAVNPSSLNLIQVVLNSDLNKTFPYPCTYTIVNPPTVRSSGSALVVNPSYNGSDQVSLTSPAASTLLPVKRDTLVYTVLVEPRNFYGIVKNSVVGFAEIKNGLSVADSSNNGFAWDPDNDGDPTNNNIVTLIDIQPIDLFIPDGFSPNDDGKYDYFLINGLNGRAVKLTVFNRWGSKVFIKEGTDISWDGRTNVNGLTLGNNKLPPATYYYVLEFLDGSKPPINGFIVLQY